MKHRPHLKAKATEWIFGGAIVIMAVILTGIVGIGGHHFSWAPDAMNTGAAAYANQHPAAMPGAPEKGR